MAAKTKKNVFSKLRCKDCGKLNYFTNKSKKAGEIKLSLQKFCNDCRKHTVHKEAKK
ncbi:MAG: 50S ribosomal protein L33 [Candidatus Wildermuthbacteria bacterium]|nr:50S ribosomal protein L33 [Candidatus Wildermuthbacteria bacterium]